MSKQEFDQQLEEDFVPHATVQYDDINPKNVLEAYKLLDQSKFEKNVPLREIVLWEVSAGEQKPVAKFSLGK